LLYSQKMPKKRVQKQFVEEKEFDDTVTSIKLHVDGVEERLNSKIDDVEDRLTNRIDGVEERLTGEIRELRSVTESMFKVVESIDGQLKELKDVPERVDRHDAEIFNIKLQLAKK